jgi:Family of unknown function (DUF5677)
MIPEEKPDSEARKSRFLPELKAYDLLLGKMNEVLDRSEEAIKIRETQPERDLDLLVATMHGKAGKTYQAILELCLSGFGEDALVLLRSNINLMINLLYILSEDSAKRAGDLVAYSHKEQEKYLRLAHGRRPEWMEKLDWDKINRYADAWEHNIATKAESCKQSFHYNVGYRFYSRIEHSDAWSLSNLIDENETQIRIASELSDKYVSIALVHSFAIMANIFLAFCSHFKIPYENIEATVRKEWNNLGNDSHKITD